MPIQEVPIWLKDSGGAASKQLGHSRDYEYSHSVPENVTGQDYMIEPISFYRAKRVGAESEIANRLDRWTSIKLAIEANNQKERDDS